jgi:tetratricopeptide (TPR) repeat protein
MGWKNQWTGISLGLWLAGCVASAGLHPEAVRLNRIGVERLRAGEHGAARTAFMLSLEYSPCYPDALHNLALVEQFENEALACRPDLVQAVNGLGAIARARGRPEQAAHWFQRAVGMDPGYLDARRNLILTLIDLDVPERLRVQVDRLRLLNPGDPVLEDLAPDIRESGHGSAQVLGRHP